MSDKPWIDNYEPHEWKVYHIKVSDFPAAKPPTAELDTYLCVCAAKSEKAEQCAWLSKHRGEHHPHFFYDIEFRSAEIDIDNTVSLGKLAGAWNKHAAGALVCETMDRIHEGFFTYLVEKTDTAA